MEFSRMTQKWSSRPKEHHAARVRENQRRHRARTKAHIATLEKQLSEVQARLDEALAENMRLLSRLKSIKDGESGACPGAALPAAAPDAVPHRSMENTASSLADGLNDDRAARQIPATGSLQGQQLSPLPPRTNSDCSVFSPQPTPVPLEFSEENADLARLQKDCQYLPPPGQGESTIPCRAAYGIIEERNYNSVDLGAIDKFLAPGFRRAVTSEGCRVESHLVFSVLDSLCA